MWLATPTSSKTIWYSCNVTCRNSLYMSMGSHIFIASTHSTCPWMRDTYMVFVLIFAALPLLHIQCIWQHIKNFEIQVVSIINIICVDILIWYVTSSHFVEIRTLVESLIMRQLSHHRNRCFWYNMRKTWGLSIIYNQYNYSKSLIWWCPYGTSSNLERFKNRLSLFVI
jgi:hypothetical protein